LWRLFDPDQPGASFEALAAPLRALVAQGRTTSGGLSAGYYSAFRVAEKAEGRFAPLMAPPLPAEQVEASLSATGSAVFARALRAGQPPAQASRQALVGLAGAVSRLSLDAGRSVVVGSSVADPGAQGWARVTAGRACAFCAMLASRGPVYSEQTVDFDAHDHCACTAEPVIGDYRWPPSSQRYSELWAESTAGLSGADARRAFRRAVDAIAS
jgi:hypothetical protein